MLYRAPAGRAALAALALAFAPGALAEEAAAPLGLIEASQSITERTAIGRIQFLASDELGGRMTGTPDLDIAARYLATELSSAGLLPGGDDGTFFYDTGLKRMGVSPASGLQGPGGARYALDEKDAAMLPGSGEGEVEAQVVFCGYGITSDDPAYDDFAGVDVKDRIALVLRYEPGELDEKSPFGGKEHTRHAYIQTKLQAAARAGAKAVILVTGPHYHAEDAFLSAGEGGYSLGAAQPERRGRRGGRGGAALPAIHLSQDAAEALLSPVGFDLAAAQKGIDQTSAPASQVLPLALKVTVKREPQPVKAKNVIALLEGRDPVLKSEVVVVGAHYDHVGISGSGPDRIHNGADDNASGTAAVLEAAVAMARSGIRPKRSILFMFFTAEEVGLLGSFAWCERPTVPLDKVVGMINLDMVGRNDPKDMQVLGSGQAPGLYEKLEAANQLAGIGFTFQPTRAAGGGSDHMPFIRKGIPAIHLFSGFHPDYHQPSDHWDKIEAGKVARSARLAALTAYMVAEDGSAAQTPAQPNKPRSEMF